MAVANPALSRMGLEPTDRIVMFHADDIGMCEATVTAFAEVMDYGLVRSGAVMVPCPWFPLVAEYCRENPGTDVGVHATVTCEWLPMRWGPISTRDPKSGLIDQDGYLHRRSPAVREHADSDAVRVEVDAQIDRALAAGIDVTHVDQHMFTLAHPRLFPAYLEAVLPRGVPPILMRTEAYQDMGFGEDEAKALLERINDLETRGYSVFDSVTQLPLRGAEGQVELTKGLIDAMEPGLHMIIMHPAVDTPELRRIVPNWEARVANYDAMLSTELRDHVQNSGVHLIGYRELRELLRSRL